CGIAYALYYVFTTPSPGFKGYLDIPSLVLLALMPPSVLLLSHTLGDLFTGISTVFKSMFNRHNRHQKEIIEILTQSSALVRAQGMGALVKVRPLIRYDLLRDGVSLIVNNFTEE